MLKSKIRKKILKIRKKKNNGKVVIKFYKVYNLLKNITQINKKIIGGYYPINHEIDDLKMLKEFEKKKIKISLPIIKKNSKMIFAQCSLNDPFVINRYGIPEPTSNKIVIPDILLVPLVAFDKKLNRLGYGGGFYDRAIKLFKSKKKIITIGLAFDFQEVYFLPVSRHDQKLDYIITNKNILR